MTQRTPTLLLDDLVFPEGPRWHDGRLWFSDLHGFEVVAVDLEGRRETVASVPTRPSGLGWLPDGRLLVVSMEDRRLLRLEPGGLVEHADLSALVGSFCNDMVVDARGRAYVGNFGFDLYGGGERADTTLVLVNPEGGARIVADGLGFPNGTVVTPDGRTLILGETFARRLTAFDVEDDGSLSNRRVWAQLDEGVPDGICLDAEGCIWIASPREPSAHLRIAEGGEVRDRIEVPGMGAYACMLGGPERRTLFLCEAVGSRPGEIGRGNGRVRAVEVDVPGVGLP